MLQASVVTESGSDGVPQEATKNVPSPKARTRNLYVVPQAGPSVGLNEALASAVVGKAVQSSSESPVLYCGSYVAAPFSTVQEREKEPSVREASMPCGAEGGPSGGSTTVTSRVAVSMVVDHLKRVAVSVPPGVAQA